MSVEEEIQQKVEQQVQEFKRLSNIWSYWETYISGIMLVVGAYITIVLSNLNTGIPVIFLAGYILHNAEIKRLANLQSYHAAVLWEALIRHNQALMAIEVTIDTLGLYDQANDKLKDEIN